MLKISNEIDLLDNLKNLRIDLNNPEKVTWPILLTSPSYNSSPLESKTLETNSAKRTIWIENDLIYYSVEQNEDEVINLHKFFNLCLPLLLLGVIICNPGIAFASEKIQKKVINSTISLEDLNELKKIGETNSFKVYFPSHVREQLATKARLERQKGKNLITRSLVSSIKVIRKERLFNPIFPIFKEPAKFVEIPQYILPEKLIIINNQRTNIFFEKKLVSVEVLVAGILARLTQNLIENRRISNIRAGDLMPNKKGFFSFFSRIRNLFLISDVLSDVYQKEELSKKNKTEENKGSWVWVNEIENKNSLPSKQIKAQGILSAAVFFYILEQFRLYHNRKNPRKIDNIKNNKNNASYFPTNIQNPFYKTKKNSVLQKTGKVLYSLINPSSPVVYTIVFSLILIVWWVNYGKHYESAEAYKYSTYLREAWEKFINTELWKKYFDENWKGWIVRADTPNNSTSKTNNSSTFTTSQTNTDEEDDEINI